MIKVTKITTIDYLPGQYAHVCPVCHRILATTTELGMMPEFSTCDCKEPAECAPKDYTIEPVWGAGSGYAVIRNKFPRFCANYDGGTLKDMEIIDHCSDDVMQNAVSETMAHLKHTLYITRN